MTEEVQTLLFVAETGDVPELDLHGVSPGNVSHEVDDFVSRSSFHGDTAVRVIHGKGEGKLAAKLREALREHPLVRDHMVIRGGGATAIVLK